MILVTVGTEKYPFDRLMIWLNVLIQHHLLDVEQEEVIAQYGNCRILPRGVRVYDLLPGTKFQSLLQSARLVISHCGEGSIDTLEALNVPYILVPRSSRFGEHVDDHQVELATALADMGVPVAWSPGDLIRFIVAPHRMPLSMVPANYMVGLCHQLQTRFEPRTRMLMDVSPRSK